MPFVIADDRSSGILFSNPEETPVDGISAEFQKTTLSFTGNGSLTYDFYGTRIYVFGSLVSLANFKQVEPITLSFTVDGEGPVPDTISINQARNQHILEFDSGSISDQQHQLNMSWTCEATGNFFLDYVIHDASENSTISDSSRIFIDDTSPFLQWSSGGWSSSHTPTFSESSPTSGTFNQSAAESTNSGATVSLLFWGSYFEIHGPVLSSGSPVASYTLDENPTPTPINMPSSGDLSSGPAYNWPLGSGNMDEGLHNLSITSLSSGFYLDYILIGATKAYVPPPMLLGGITTSATVSATGTSPNGASGSSGGKGASTGAIVGGVVGGVVVVGILAATFMLWYRRQRSQWKRPMSSPDIGVSAQEGIQPIPSPYTGFQPANHQGSSSTGTREHVIGAHMSESGLNNVSNRAIIEEYKGNRESIIESQRRKEDALSNAASAGTSAPPAYSDV